MTIAASTPVRALALAAAMLAWASAAAAQTTHTIFAGVFSTPFHRDAPDENPWGIRAAASFVRGLGIEGRWADTDASDYWSVALIQMLPGAHGAKTIQPYGSIGGGRLTRGGGDATFVALAGGVVTFIGHVGLGIDFRYLRGTERLGGEKIAEQHVSFELLWRF